MRMIVARPTPSPTEWQVVHVVTGVTHCYVSGPASAAQAEADRLDRLARCADCDRVEDRVEGQWSVCRLLPEWHLGGHNPAFPAALDDPDLRGEADAWVNG